MSTTRTILDSIRLHTSEVLSVCKRALFDSEQQNRNSIQAISLEERIMLSAAPVADINGNPVYCVVEGSSITLDSADLSDEDAADIELYEWDFDYDGTFTVDTSSNLDSTTTFDASLINGPATRTIALRITDELGDTSLDTATVNILDGGNVLPTASNLNQFRSYSGNDTAVALDDIVVNDSDAGELITATLTLANPAAGSLSAGSGNGESYSSVNGVWTITASVGQVNSALAAVEFVPGMGNAVTTFISTRIVDSSGGGPAEGTIGLNATNPTLDSTSEFLVNQTTADDQQTSGGGRGSQNAVAIDNEGNYVVVWSSLNQDGSDWGVYARRFDSSGTAITGEILVAETSIRIQQWARVASAADGTFVVTWTNEPTNGAEDVYFRRFGADGAALTGEIRVNTTTAGSQENSSIAINRATGQFIIVWKGNGTQSGETDSDGIFGQRFDATGSAIGGEFRVNANTSGGQYDPSVSVNANGQFVVSWDDNDGFHFQRFDSAGNEVGAMVTVDPDATAGNGSVAVHSDGSFVVVWRDDSGGFLLHDVHLQRFGSGGAALTSQLTVATTSLGDQTNPSIAMAASGDFIVTWEGSGLFSFGVYGQKYDSLANQVGGEFLVNQSIFGLQHMASIAMLDIDNFVVVWSGAGDQAGQTDSSGVFARQFGIGNRAPTGIAPISPSINEGTDTAGGHSLGTLSAIDPDATETFTWAVVGGPDQANFTIGGVGNNQLLLDDGVLDFESQPSYSVTIRATDSAGNAVDATLTIMVNDINDPPMITSDGGGLTAIVVVSENTTAVTTVTATDADLPAPTLAYSIAGGADAGFFTINGSTGELSFVAAPDRESPGDLNSDNVYEVRVRASDGFRNSPSQLVFVSVVDVNETPIVANPVPQVTVNEDAADIVIDLSTVFSDPEGGSLTWSIVSNSNASLVSSGIVGSQMTLSFAANQHGTGGIVIRAADSGGLSVDLLVNVTVQPVNDAPTVSLANTISSLDEDTSTAAAIRVADIAVTDDDEGTNVLGLAGPDAGLFEIVAGELRLKAGTVLDFENFDSYSVVVTIDDPTIGSGIEVAISFLVSVVDINETPIVVNPISPVVVNEDAADIVIDLSTAFSDPEGGSLTWSIVSNSNGSLVSSGIVGSQMTLSFAANQHGTGGIVIRAADSGGLSVDLLVNVTVQPVNDAPTVSLANTISSLDEDTSTAAAIRVADIAVTDDDEGTNVLGLAGPDAGLFEIVAGELRLKAGTVLDFENFDSYSVVVTIDDPTIGSGIEDAISFTLTINLVNHVPVFVGPSQIDLTEDAPLSQFDWSDWFVDSDGNQLNFSIVSVADSWVRATPGSMLTLETDPNVWGLSHIVVRATDPYGLSANANIAINVSPVNDTVGVANQSFLADFGLPITGALLNPPVDADGELLTVVVTSAPTGGQLTVRPDGSFEFTPDVGFFGTTNFRFVVEDGVAASAEATITLQSNPPPPSPVTPPAPARTPKPTAALTPAPAPTPVSDDIKADESVAPVEPVLGDGNRDPGSDAGAAFGRNGDAVAATEESEPDVVPETESLSVLDSVAAEDSPNSLQPVSRQGSDSPESLTSAMAETVQTVIVSGVSAFSVITQPGLLWHDLDLLKESTQSQTLAGAFAVGSVGTVSSSLIVGYVIWAVRSGLLLSSVVATMPAWNLLDPLAIIPIATSDNGEDGESLEDIVESQKKKLANTNTG